MLFTGRYEEAAQALIYAGLGDKDRTLEALDRVAALGAVRVGRALNSPEFARFAAIRE